MSTIQLRMLKILGGRRSVPIHVVEASASAPVPDAQRALRSTQVGAPAFRSVHREAPPPEANPNDGPTTSVSRR